MKRWETKPRWLEFTTCMDVRRLGEKKSLGCLTTSRNNQILKPQNLHVYMFITQSLQDLTHISPSSITLQTCWWMTTLWIVKQYRKQFKKVIKLTKFIFLYTKLQLYSYAALTHYLESECTGFLVKYKKIEIVGFIFHLFLINCYKFCFHCVIWHWSFTSHTFTHCKNHPVRITCCYCANYYYYYFNNQINNWDYFCGWGTGRKWDRCLILVNKKKRSMKMFLWLKAHWNIVLKCGFHALVHINLKLFLILCRAGERHSGRDTDLRLHSGMCWCEATDWVGK